MKSLLISLALTLQAFSAESQAQGDSYLYGSGRQRTYSAGSSSHAKRPMPNWTLRANSYNRTRSWYDGRRIYQGPNRRNHP